MRRILVVEDEPRIAAFIEKGLRAEGYTPTIAADGITGFDYAMSGEFDLTILDIGLPGMDGFKVLSRLRDSGSSMPVIVLTARDSGTDTVRGLEGGADDYVPKPFRFAELLARIKLRLRTRTEAAGGPCHGPRARSGAARPANPSVPTSSMCTSATCARSSAPT